MFKLLNSKKFILGILILFLVLYIKNSFAQNSSSFCVSQDELSLFQEINKYREMMGKTPLGLSNSLSYVAMKHLEDILQHKPDTGICTPYSWSYGNELDSCCIATTQESLLCSRNKPLFLSEYPDIAYEMIYYDDHKADPLNALRFWKSVKLSKDMLLGEGKYADFEWVSIGIAIQKEYVSVWLGIVPDIISETPLCNTDEVIKFVLPKELEGKKFLSKPDNKFHIVMASAANMEEIKVKFERLKKTDIKQLRIVKAKDRCRIIVGSYSDRKEANQQLKKYKKYVKDAWILQY